MKTQQGFGLSTNAQIVYRYISHVYHVIYMFVYHVVIIIQCIYCGFPSERRRQLPCVNHFLSSVSSDAIGQAAQQRGGHSHSPLDLHQITAGQTCRLSFIVEI